MAKFIDDIMENYRKLEHELVTQLSYEVEHGVITGSNREEIWVDFFRRIVPKKFNIARSVFIIDSYSESSKEVDIAIYDEQYTPYIFNYGNIKFIPIEAVAAVVQCKSINPDKKELLEWTTSIEALKTSRNSIARLANGMHVGINENENREPIQFATTPIKILCYISETKKRKRKHEGKDSFDIVIEAYQEEKRDNNKEKEGTNIKNERFAYLGNLKILFKKDKNLHDVLCRYNRNNKDYDKGGIKEKLEEIKISDYAVSKEKEEYTLLSFIFQFNQMLMIINNPMFFPHKAYVDMFNNRKGDSE